MNLEPAAKQAARTLIAQEDVPRYLGPINERVASSATGFIANVASGEGVGAGGLTIADLHVYGTIHWLRSGLIDFVPTTVVDAFPALLALSAKVAALPETIALEETYKPKA
jgi:glutathione S-transferase